MRYWGIVSTLQYTLLLYQHEIIIDYTSAMARNSCHVPPYIDCGVMMEQRVTKSEIYSAQI